MIKKWRAFFVIFFFGLCPTASCETLTASETDAIVSKIMTEILTTKTGCEITETFFMLDEKSMQRYFGINAEAAQKIAGTCRGSNKPLMSFFYYIPESKRPVKTYRIQIDSDKQFFTGWTNTNNETQIFITKMDEGLLRQILTHELIVTMDDKFKLSYEKFKLFNFTSAFPTASHCKINRFLANPFFQAVLTGVRAYRMELRFAQDLNDKDWLETLARLKVIQMEPGLSFKYMTEALWPVRQSLMSFYQEYQDFCSDQKLNTKSIQHKQIDALIRRDFEELKKDLSGSQLSELLEFLIFEIAISNSDSNIVNFGPRPNIGSGGWSLRINDFERLRETIPQRQFGNRDQFKELTKVRTNEFNILDASKSKIEEVPMPIAEPK